MHRAPYAGVAARAGRGRGDPRRARSRGPRETLERHGFDAAAFERLRAGLRDGSLTAAANVVTGVGRAATAVRPDRAAGARRAGLRRGDGGRRRRASRRARSRSSCSPAGWRRGSAAGSRRSPRHSTASASSRSSCGRRSGSRGALGAEIPVVLMTSFATDEAVRAHVAERRARRAALLHARRRRPGCGPTAACSRRGRARLPLRPGHGDLLGVHPRLGRRSTSSRAAASARSSSRTSTTWRRGSTPRSRACTCSRERRSRSRSSARARTAAALRRASTAGHSSSRRSASRPSSTRAGSRSSTRTPR